MYKVLKQMEAYFLSQPAPASHAPSNVAPSAWPQSPSPSGGLQQKKIRGSARAVAKPTGIPNWLALASGNMDQKLRFGNPSGLIWSHTQIGPLCDICSPAEKVFSFGGLIRKTH